MKVAVFVFLTAALVASVAGRPQTVGSAGASATAVNSPGAQFLNLQAQVAALNANNKPGTVTSNINVATSTGTVVSGAGAPSTSNLGTHTISQQSETSVFQG